MNDRSEGGPLVTQMLPYSGTEVWPIHGGSKHGGVVARPVTRLTGDAHAQQWAEKQKASQTRKLEATALS